jgi:hypothetical protein
LRSTLGSGRGWDFGAVSVPRMKRGKSLFDVGVVSNRHARKENWKLAGRMESAATVQKKCQGTTAMGD